MQPEECILFSGAAKGAEAAFGSAAERYGVEEVNFSFDGQTNERTRGIRILTQAELLQGDVSLAYVSRLMNRAYPDTPRFRKILQSIWHQVNNGQEVYIIGQILDDGTVKGGTGWGAEFAKLCNKPLFVFDQHANGWSVWQGQTWHPIDPPEFGHVGITGSGSRVLEQNGRDAIDELFERSFE